MRLEVLRAGLWRQDVPSGRDVYLAVIAELIERLVAARATRWEIARELREAGYGHSEIGMLRRWAIRRSHFDLDEVLAAISSEIRGKHESAPVRR